MTFLVKHKGIACVVLILLGGFALIFSQQDNGITVKNPQAKNSIKLKPASQTGLLSGLLDSHGSEQNSGSIDSAKSMFINQNDVPSAQRQAVISYIAKANDAIPLTTDALSFALQELILGEYGPLNDAVNQLQQGQQALGAIQPPLEAIAFHKASLILLAEYQRILRVPLTIPRAEFDPKKMAGDFQKLAALIIVARHELNLLTSKYGAPLFPKVISFYDDAIGAS